MWILFHIFFCSFLVIWTYIVLGGVIMVKSIIYFIIALATTFYAIPRIPLIGNHTVEILYSVSWLAFALLILGAHVDRLLILDETKKKRLEQLKKLNRRKREQQILQLQNKHLKRSQQVQ